MNLTIIQRAKFALLYQKSPAILEDVDGPFVGMQNAESALNYPAIVELNGLRLTSERPNSAADAAKINEKIEAIMDETLQWLRTP